jgi:uncharacterized protein (DUF2235 family)
MKHLIVGIDGTWRAAFGEDFHSNVFRLNLALEHQDRTGNPQIFIYSGGLGTNGVSSQITGGLLADGLDENILQAYINICSNFEPGDKIYLFGFSRGAVAARALCGFISTCGLLKAEASWLINVFWKNFAKTANQKEVALYNNLQKEKTHPDARVEFLGVFDTVCGPFRQEEVFRRLRFQSLDLDRSVKHGVHVVSIDDTRLYFTPVLWRGRSDADQTIEQIWMPGVHSDIGGGYQNSFLSSLSLVLMIDKLSEYCTDLKLNEIYIDDHILDRIKIDDIVVNDEWGYKLSSFLSKQIPRGLEGGDGLHTQHPITNMLCNKHFKIRKAVARYVPSFRLEPAGHHLGDTQFQSTSWHARKVADLLDDRIKKLP